MTHIPVLVSEVIASLQLAADDVVFDGTVGSAGHAQAICTQLGPAGVYIGVDQDRRAIQLARSKLEDTDCRTHLQTANFRDPMAVLDQCSVKSIDNALLDLGFRSEQLESNRGFSFKEDEPLVMTYKKKVDLDPEDTTAKQVVNEWSQDSLEKILAGYANEQFNKEIAKAIVGRRQIDTIKTTHDLVETVKSAVPRWYQAGDRHPATKTFQAVRMAVNDELAALQDGISRIFRLLSHGGRLAVISFHSGEDRIVKQFFQKQAKQERGEPVTDSPITPKEAEIDMNSRSRSAKLRVIEKI